MRDEKDTYFRCADCKQPFRLRTRDWVGKDQPFTTDLPWTPAKVKPLCMDCYDRRFLRHVREAMA